MDRSAENRVGVKMLTWKEGAEQDALFCVKREIGRGKVAFREGKTEDMGRVRRVRYWSRDRGRRRIKPMGTKSGKGRMLSTDTTKGVGGPKRGSTHHSSLTTSSPETQAADLERRDDEGKGVTKRQ
jgi:hypothetical protein